MFLAHLHLADWLAPLRSASRCSRQSTAEDAPSEVRDAAIVMWAKPVEVLSKIN